MKEQHRPFAGRYSTPPQGTPHTASASADITFSANTTTIPLSRSTSSVSNNRRRSATPRTPRPWTRLTTARPIRRLTRLSTPPDRISATQISAMRCGRRTQKPNPETKTSHGAPDPGRTRLTGHKINTAHGIRGGATDRRRYDTIVHSRQTKDRFTPRPSRDIPDSLHPRTEYQRPKYPRCVVAAEPKSQTQKQKLVMAHPTPAGRASLGT